MTAVEMITREVEEKLTPSRSDKTKSIVVATDGSDSALAAFNAANLIRAKTGARVDVLSVLEPIPLVIPVPEAMVIPPDLEKARRDAQTAIVRDQVARFDPEGDWRMEVRLGRRADVIVDFAHERKADLIIVGANRHGVWGRIFGEETAIEIARLSDVPLLVASPGMKRLPKRVIVAMDLNPDGLQCAPQALESIADTPSISCVHVKPRSESMGIDWAEYDAEYELLMRERFKELEKGLKAVHLRPDLVTLHGEPARELAEFAAYSKAEIIVVGVKRRRGRAHAVGGRIAGRVIRHATCSVLVVPNLIPREASVVSPEMATDVIRDSRLWSVALREFTTRNAGRIVDLEVDDPEIGALVEASRYPLLGADYDHKDGCVTIMLGPMRGVDKHLTRTIARPEAISVLNVDGRDTALSVSHGGGQTLLKF